MSNILLIFFALPIAVVIISIALQKIFKNPILVAAIIFAIFLIVTFVVGNLEFLVATIAYTILSFVTAILTYIICRLLNEQMRCCCMNNNNNNGNNGITTVSNVNSQNCGCNCNNDNNNDNQVLGANGISARINVIPSNNGETGNISGCYRRR